MNQREFDLRFGGILFVTTQVARDRMGVPDQFTELGDLAGGFLVTVANPVNVYDAIKSVRTARANLGNVNGIVLLGNYDELPPAKIQVATVKDAGPDLDHWKARSDDCYGGNLVAGGEPVPADIPVSRLPIVPTFGGLLSDPPLGTPENGTSLGVRSTEFRFADALFSLLPHSSETGRKVSLAAESCALVSGNEALDFQKLQATYDYLMLHGINAASSGLSGVCGDVLVNQGAVLGGTYRGNTIFCGACWGGLLAKRRLVSQANEPFNYMESLGLIFVDRGANAFVGFTSSHWVPTDDDEQGSYNATLHRRFWHYTIDELETPAMALFRARRDSVGRLGAQKNPGAKERAAVLKGYWSATCLGTGW